MTVFKALVITEHKQKTPLTLAEFPEPSLEEGEILIANEAVAQNPVDWKQIDRDFGIKELPWVVGGDLAGRVYKVGPGVTEYSVGDRVISFASRHTARHAAFQTHTVVLVRRTVQLPETYSFEEGSTILLAFVTAAAGFAGALPLHYPEAIDSPAKSNGIPILVWGGSSSVGAFAVQIAKINGYTVLATASSKNFEYVKSLGADHVFDYHDPDVVKKIRETAGPNLSLVYDAISENGSQQASAASVTSPSGGSVIVVLDADPNASTEKVKIKKIGAQLAADDLAVGRNIYAFLRNILNKRLLKGNAVKIIPGGLLGLNEGLELGRRHQVSGEKLVYVVKETPGL